MNYLRLLHNPARLLFSPLVSTTTQDRQYFHLEERKRISVECSQKKKTRSPGFRTRSSDLQRPHPVSPVLPSTGQQPQHLRKTRMPSSSRNGRKAKDSAFQGFDSQGRSYSSATEMWTDYTGQVGVDGMTNKRPSSGMLSNGVAPEKLSSGAPVEMMNCERDGADSVMAVAENLSTTPGADSQGEEKRERWYEDGLNYWKAVDASVDGVLGGYGKVSPIDISDSKEFLLEMYGRELAAARATNRPTVAADCGAGIGRVTKGLLLPIFDEVDLVEPAPHFLAQAKVDLSSSKGQAGEATDSAEAAVSGHTVSNFFCVPLQDFNPEAGRYDVIWVQWCIGHLTDTDFISFFKRAQEGLRPGGLIVLKENTCQQGFVLDNADSSITRSDSYFRSLFQQAGLRILKSKVQRSFPKELFTVKMYALRAVDKTKDPRHRKPRNLPGIISV